MPVESWVLRWALKGLRQVHISGHHGQLNSSFENTRLVIKEGKGYLVVDAEALNMQGENRTFKDLVLAEVDLSGATLENNVLSAKNAAVTVTVEGSEAIFAGQYNDADKRAMAPLSFKRKTRFSAGGKQGYRHHG